MKIYSHYGVNEFVLCLGYRGNMIKEYFLNYEAMNNDFTIRLGDDNRVTYHSAHTEGGFSITLVDTGPETMTGGRVKRIEKYIDEDAFMVTYGDGVADLDVNKLLAFHRSHGRTATITTVRPISRFGMVNLDVNKGEVVSFTEKPQVHGWINAGFMVFSKRVFDYLGGDDCMLETEPMENLTKEKQLMAYRHEGFFFAMDTFREYKYLNQLWAGGQAPWKVWK